MTAYRKPRVLVSAASKHGSTAEIADDIADRLRSAGIDARSLHPDHVGEVGDYDAFIVGSAFYAGRWLPSAVALARHLGPRLEGRPVWLFTSGPVGDPDRWFVKKMTEEPPMELDEVMMLTEPRDHRIFGGKLTPEKLPRFQRLATRLVGGLDGDFRDWHEIGAWVDSIAIELRLIERYRQAS